VHNLFPSAEGRIDIDHPVVDEQSVKEVTERGFRGDLLERAVELEFAVPKQMVESLCELAVEDAAERNDRQKEALGAVYPLRAIGSQTNARNDVVNVRMVLHRLPPGVQHSEETDIGAQMLGVASQLEYRFSAGAVKQVADDPLVAPAPVPKADEAV